MPADYLVAAVAPPTAVSVPDRNGIGVVATIETVVFNIVVRDFEVRSVVGNRDADDFSDASIPHPSNFVAFDLRIRASPKKHEAAPATFMPADVNEIVVERLEAVAQDVEAHRSRLARIAFKPNIS